MADQEARILKRIDALPISASGDDELKEALREYKAASISESRAIETAMGNRHYDPSGSVIRIRDAQAKVESLFGRIREERDRAQQGQEALRRSYHDALLAWEG